MKVKTHFVRIETGIQDFCRYEVKAATESAAIKKAVKQHILERGGNAGSKEYVTSNAYYEGCDDPDRIRAQRQRNVTGFNYPIRPYEDIV